MHNSFNRCGLRLASLHPASDSRFRQRKYARQGKGRTGSHRARSDPCKQLVLDPPVHSQLISHAEVAPRDAAKRLQRALRCLVAAGTSFRRLHLAIFCMSTSSLQTDLLWTNAGTL